MSQLVIIGAGGLARILVDILRASEQPILGFITNQPETASGNMAGIPRLGDDAALLARGPADIELVNAIGSVKAADVRRGIFQKYKEAGFSFASVVHPTAVLASDVEIGEGAQIMANAVLQPEVKVGANALVNMGALVDHETVIGAHTHVAPGTKLGGYVTVGHSALIGLGASVLQGVRIGDRAIVAAGSVVVADVAAETTVMGVPARVRISG